MVALMALSLSSTFVSCSDNDDDEPNLAKEIAGAYKGYSVGACNMFSDYLLGDESTATITANEDGTINLVYKSGSGDFTLNNLKLSSNKSFSGSGEVAMSMGGSTGGVVRRGDGSKQLHQFSFGHFRHPLCFKKCCAACTKRRGRAVPAQ